VAGNGVSAIGGVNHYTAFLDDFGRLFDEARLGGFCVDLEKLTHDFLMGGTLFAVAGVIVNFTLQFEYNWVWGGGEIQLTDAIVDYLEAGMMALGRSLRRFCKGWRIRGLMA